MPRAAADVLRNWRRPMIRAGLPPTISSGPTFFTTTALAPTTAARPTRTPGAMNASVPTHTPSSIATGGFSNGNAGSFQIVCAGAHVRAIGERHAPAEGHFSEAVDEHILAERGPLADFNIPGHVEMRRGIHVHVRPDSRPEEPQHAASPAETRARTQADE